MQEKILQESHRILKPEGFLFYVTCSLIEEENESQISTFIKKYKNYNLIQLDHVLADNSKLLPEAIRLFPPKTNSEGFFACLLRKARKP